MSSRRERLLELERRVQAALAATHPNATVTVDCGRVVVGRVRPADIIRALLALPVPDPAPGPCPWCGHLEGEPEPEPTPDAARPEDAPQVKALLATASDLGELYAAHDTHGCPEMFGLDAAIAPALDGWWDWLGPDGQAVVRAALCSFVGALDAARGQLASGTATRTLVALSRDGRRELPKPHQPNQHKRRKVA